MTAGETLAPGVLAHIPIKGPSPEIHLMGGAGNMASAHLSPGPGLPLMLLCWGHTEIGGNEDGHGQDPDAL